MQQAESESSYQQASSDQIIVEFGQLNKDMIGCVVTETSITGDFGVAEIFKSRGDKLAILDSNHHELKVINKIYRGIIVKSNKKKQSRTQQLKNQTANVEDDEANDKSSQNLFDSSESSHEQPAKKRRKKQEKGKSSDVVGRTRIIRKIRTLSKKKQTEGD